MRTFTFLLCCLPLCVVIQKASAAPGDLLAEIRFDINQDGTADRAILFRRKDGDDSDVSLAIFEDGADTPVVLAPAVAWVGGIGQQPELASTPQGSLQVISMNESIGRDRWRQTLTIAYRGGRYVLAGITHDWWDTLDPANQGECDINLITGKGRLEEGETGHGKPITVKVRSLPIEDWDGHLPGECGLDFQVTYP